MTSRRLIYNLKKHLGTTGEHKRIYDVVKQVAQSEDEIDEKFGVDAIDIGCIFNEKDSYWYDTTLVDGLLVQVRLGVQARKTA